MTRPILAQKKMFCSSFFVWITFFFLGFGMILGGQSLVLADAPVKLAFKVEQVSSDGVVRGTLSLKVAPGWKFYGPPAKTDTLQKAPEIFWEKGGEVVQVHARFPEGESWEEHGQTGHIYRGIVSIPLEITLEKKCCRKTWEGALELRGLACSNMCQPIHESFKIQILPQHWTKSSFLKTGGGASMGYGWEMLMKMILWAFFGGVILNLMPCVLPVLGLKIRSITKGKEQFRSMCLYSALGITTSFLGFAVVTIALKHFFHQEVGWGMQLQNPYFVSLLTLVIAIFSLSLLGAFHFDTPRWVLAIAPHETHSRWGAFFSGVLSVFLATPCCAPLMGSAVGFAMLYGPLEIFVIFFSLSLGFALPYLLGFFFPVAQILPKGGNWTLWIERAIGATLLGTAGWLFWIFSQRYSLKELFLVLVCFFLGIGAFVAGLRISSRKTPGYGRVGLLGVAFIGGTGFVTSALWLPYLGLAMPRWQGEQVWSPSKKVLWHRWSPHKMEAFLAQGKIIFLDVTAQWCVTCQSNKKLAMQQPRVEALLSQSDVVAMRADYTQEDAEITQLLRLYKRSGIPLNVVVSRAYPQGIILSSLLTPQEVEDAFSLIRKLSLTSSGPSR